MIGDRFLIGFALPYVFLIREFIIGFCPLT